MYHVMIEIVPFGLHPSRFEEIKKFLLLSMLKTVVLPNMLNILGKP